MIPVRILTISCCIFLVILITGAAAFDCGCGGDSDDSSPSGWDDGGDSGNSGDGGTSDNGSDSADDSNTGSDSDTDSGSDTGSGSSDSSGENGSQDTGYDDGGSDSSSTDSGGSSGSGGGSAEEGLLWRMKGDDLYAKGLYNESLSSYEKSISYDPFSFRSWKGKGQVLLALGIPDDAARAFLQALKLDPTDAGTYALLGDARIASGDYKDAAEQYLKALAINPKIEGVPEKLSAAYAANNPVQAVETMTDSPSIPPTTGTPALPDQGISAAGDTVSLTVKETLPAAPAATVAGFPGAVAGILGALLVFILIGFSRK